jgi:ketosteroid isomerase-like protein
MVKDWVEAFNSQDIEKLSNFYAEDAINHQVANEPVEGKETIKKMFEDEFAQAEMTCTVENIFELRNADL